MGISYGSGSQTVARESSSGASNAVHFSTRSSQTILQCGDGCDIAYFGERDYVAGESRLAAVVITRHRKRLSDDERRALRERPLIKAAMTAVMFARRLTRWLPWFVRNVFAPRDTQVFYDSSERVLTVDGRVYGPLIESEILLVLFDVLSQPHTQTTIVRPAPTPVILPANAPMPHMREGASRAEWRAALRSTHEVKAPQVSAWADACVNSVPAAAEFVRVSNAMAA